MKVERTIHRAWKELDKARKKGFEGLPNIVGKYHYVYSSKKGEISLISLPDYFRNGETRWEIMCFKGKFFEGVDRYPTKKEAVAVIEHYLD